MTRIAGCLVAISLVVSACGEPDVAPVVPPCPAPMEGAGSPGDSSPNDAWLDLMRYDPRAQMADLADVGAGGFVVGYVRAGSGLRYAGYAASGARQVAPFAAGDRASWIRANSSEAWMVGGCAVNYFAVELDQTVQLDAHTLCATGWDPMRRTLIDDGIAWEAGRPSVATRGTPEQGELLFVYGKGVHILGRLLRFRGGSPVGEPSAPFVILDIPSNTLPFSTDVIYNRHSDRFIVGAIDRYDKAGCQIRNAVLALSAGDEDPPTVETVRKVGVCDVEAGGHHTAVAYNPLGDGTYLWWRQDENLQKAIYVHDAFGAPTSLPAFSTTQTLTEPPSDYQRYTIPLAQTGDARFRYVALKANYHYGDGTYSSAIYAYGRDASWTLLDVPPAHDGQVAVRFLGGRTVGLMRAVRETGNCPTADLYLVTSEMN